jgi:subtilase family serine protease
MRLQFVLVLVCILSCFSLSYQLSKESRITIGQVNVPFQFKPVSRANSFKNLRLYISLRRRNADEMEKLFWEVSNPKSPLYAQYLTVNELGERFGASIESIHTVSNWLKENGVYDYELALAKDIIRMEASVHTLEKLFQTSIFTYAHVITGEEVTSPSGAIAVSRFISEHIQHVSGLHLFPIIETNERGLSTIGAFSKRRVDVTESNLPISFLLIIPLSAIQSAMLPPENLKLVGLQIICNNGSESVFPSCANIQSAIIQYEVNGQATPPSRVSIPISSFNVFNTSGEIIYLQAQQVVAFDNYLPYNMSTFLIYNNGSVSNPIYSPVLCYTSRYTTPENIASYYGTKSYRGTNSRNSQAFAGLIGQYFAESDLYQLFDYFGLERKNVSKIVGYNVI